MEKSFSFRVFGRYALRLWLIVFIGAVLGGIGFGVYAKLVRDDLPRMNYEGNITIAGIDKFNFGESTDVALSYYRITCERAIAVMTNEVIKSRVYTEFKDAFKDEKSFMEGIRISSVSNFMVKVKFTHAVESDEEKANVQKVVERYCQIAVEAAEKSDAVMTGKTESSFFEKTDTDLLNNGKAKMLMRIFMGAVLGALAGLVVVTIVYFCDKRLKSVASVAFYNRFLGAVRHGQSEGVVISADTALTEMQSSVAAVANAGKRADRDFAAQLAEYSRGVGRKTLLLDFCPNDNLQGVSIEDFFAGQAIPDGTEALYARTTDAWQKLAFAKSKMDALKGSYDRIVISFCTVSGAAGVVAFAADAFVLNLDQPASDIKEVFAFAEDVNDVKKLCGIVVNEPDWSFVDVKAE